MGFADRVKKVLSQQDPTADQVDVAIGRNAESVLRFSSADSSNPATVWALDNTSQQLHFTDAGAIATDWARSAGAHPELSVHSNTTPITDYLAIGNHDGTTASVDVVGGTTLDLNITGTTALALTATACTLPTDDADFVMGAGSDFIMRWSDGDSDNHAAAIGIGDTSQALHITDKGAIATDWNVAANTHPVVYVHSNTTPASDYISIGAHDGTTAAINVGGGTTLNLDIAGTTAATLTAATLSLPTGTITLADGGTVTQTTGKSTTVTLSTHSGQITTHTASLADDTVVTFTVTNTNVTALDCVILNMASGGTAGGYRISTSAVASGSFNISIKNESGGALTEGIVINFGVIQGASS